LIQFLKIKVKIKKLSKKAGSIFVIISQLKLL